MSGSLLGPALLAGLGALLAGLPHLIAFFHTGDAGYIPDMDELLYLAWSRDTVLDGSWRMTDAVRNPSGPMMHPWLLFVPVGQLGNALGVGMSGIGAVWRVVAGAGVALGIYAALASVVRHRGVALMLAALLVCDSGLSWG
jgi:hypothetical protein